MFRAIRFVLMILTIEIVPTVNVGAQIPEQARAVAVNELTVLVDKLSEGALFRVFGGEISKSEMERAVLGEGFLRKWGVSYADILTVDPEHILDCPSDYNYCFPVFVDGRFIGTIDVGEDEDNPGSYVPGTRTWGSPIFGRILEIQKEFADKKGYSVALLTVFGQSYAVLNKDSRSVSITPVEDSAARCQGIKERSNSNYPLLPVDVGLRKIQSRARIDLKVIQQDTSE